MRLNRLPRWLLSLALAGGMTAAAVELPLRWRWSNPTPHGNNLNDLAVRAGFHVAVGDRGRIYTSEDLVNWTVLATPTSRQLRAVAFTGTRLVAVGEAGTILFGETNGPLAAATVTPPTDDWFEGVAASSLITVAVGDNAAIYTSGTAGLAWQRVAAPGFSDWLRGVAFGNSTFVVVGEDGFVASSPDGRNWTPRPRPTTHHLNRVTWDGTRFLAVSDRGAVFTSATGAAWQLDSGATGTTNELNAVAAGGGRQWIAGEDVLRSRAAVSQPWSDEFAEARPPPRATYLSAAVSGTALLAGGRTGLLVEGVRTNNTTVWTDLSEGARHWLWDLARFPDAYIAVGDRATILTSPDGVNWTPELPPLSLTNALFLGLGGRTNLAVAAGARGALMISPAVFTNLVTTNTGGIISTSRLNLLGLEWHAVAPGVTNTLQGVAADAQRLVVVGDEGTVLTSPDGTNWTARTIPERPLLTSVAAHPGGYVATGRAGALFTSPDAVTWTPRATGTTNWLYRVRHFDGRLLAVGQGGTLLTSTNAVDWTPRATGTTTWLNDVIHTEGSWFLVGNQGTVRVSTNLADWTDAATITGKSLYAAAAHAGQLVLAGIEGVILRAQLTPITDPVAIAAYQHEALTNRVRDAFLFLGRTDQEFTLDAALSLPAWQPGRRFEITAPDGALVYLRETTNAPPPAQFFRARPVR